VTLPACLNLNHFRSQPSPEEVYPGMDARDCDHGRKACMRIKSESAIENLRGGFMRENPGAKKPKTKTNLKKGANPRLKK
jgi:hypothetical protein